MRNSDDADDSGGTIRIQETNPRPFRPNKIIIKSRKITDIIVDIT